MTDQDKALITQLMNDSSATVPDVKDLIAAIKAKNRDQLLAVAPKILADAKREYSDVVSALPVIKTGYQTTEFWVVVGSGVVVAVCQLTGHPLNFDVAGAMAGLAGIYVAIRGMVKKPAPVTVVQAAPSVAPATPTTVVVQSPAPAPAPTAA